MGDQIVPGGFESTVEHIEARATLICTYDGQRVVIPNSDIYTRTTVARTAFPARRSEYDVGIGYSDDIEVACRVILNALKSVEGIEKTPPPEAIPWALDASIVNIRIRWCHGATTWCSLTDRSSQRSNTLSGRQASTCHS